MRAVLAQYVHLNEINNIDAILANKLKGKFREQRKKIGKKNLASNPQIQKAKARYNAKPRKPRTRKSTTDIEGLRLNSDNESNTSNTNSINSTDC